MSLPIATELSQIVRVVYSSVLATVVFSVVFGLAVVGFSRESEMRRTNRIGTANLYKAIAFGCLAFCGAAVIYGVILVAQKS